MLALTSMPKDLAFQSGVVLLLDVIDGQRLWIVGRAGLIRCLNMMDLLVRAQVLVRCHWALCVEYSSTK